MHLADMQNMDTGRMASITQESLLVNIFDRGMHTMDIHVLTHRWFSELNKTELHFGRFEIMTIVLGVYESWKK